jgi:hypothetical protein
MLRRALCVQALLLGLLAGGCIIVADDKNHHHGDGGGGASQASSDDGAGAPVEDEGHNETYVVGGDTTSSSQDSTPHYSVYFYRDAYRNLPDMGESKKYFNAHGNLASVDRGYLNGDWHPSGAGLIKEGAGKGETVVDGNVEVKGNNWVIRNLTITGDVEIRGNNNDLSGCEILGRVEVRGVGNKTP